MALLKQDSSYRIIVIPDIHGSPLWKEILAKESFDLAVFLGDYVDSFVFPAEDQLLNLEQILEYKDKHIEQTILLLGNHDIHYLPWIVERPYSGFQRDMAPVYEKVFNDAVRKEFMQVSYVHGRLLFSHAGVTKTWCQTFDVNNEDLQANINNLLFDNPHALGFIKGNPNPSPVGDNIFQSPTWVRPASLVKDGLDGYWQITGHTQHTSVTIRNRREEKFFFCDTFRHGKDYVLFKNQTEFEIKSL